MLFVLSEWKTSCTSHRETWGTYFLPLHKKVALFLVSSKFLCFFYVYKVKKVLNILYSHTNVQNLFSNVAFGPSWHGSTSLQSERLCTTHTHLTHTRNVGKFKREMIPYNAAWRASLSVTAECRERWPRDRPCKSTVPSLTTVKSRHVTERLAMASWRNVKPGSFFKSSEVKQCVYVKGKVKGTLNDKKLVTSNTNWLQDCVYSSG